MLMKKKKRFQRPVRFSMNYVGKYGAINKEYTRTLNITL